MISRIASLALSLFFIMSPAYAEPPTAPTPVTPIPLEIVIYDKADFKGSALTLSKPVPDLSTFKFDNKVASLVIKGSGDWVLCENKNYTGRCARVQSQAGNLKLFNLNDRVSSLYPVPIPVAPVAATPTASSVKPN